MPAAEDFVEMGFPLAGLDLRGPYSAQKPIPMRNGRYGRTTRQGTNVRGWESLTSRDRGGQRPGLAKYVSTPVVASWIVQGLDTVVSTGGTPVQGSQSGRVVTLVAVSQGNVYYVVAGGTSWTAATNNTGNTPPLIYTGTVYAASINQKLWFADGSNWCYFDPSNTSVNRWTASAGSLPVDNSNNTPRLICAWRGRAVVAGFLNDPSGVWMSASGDPTNWDLTGQSLINQIQGAPVGGIVPGQAIYLANAPVGQIGDVVTTLIPYNDDILIFGGDHTIYQMSGDPMSGGQIDLVTDSIGMAWGVPWCKGPDGTIYFFSNRTGVYALTPGQQPVRISQQIEQLVQQVDTGANLIRLVWEDQNQGFHVFITPSAGAASTTHLFWEARTGAWWQDQFANTSHDPTAVAVMDGNTPGDRTVLLGGWDGYVRAVSSTATTDDGTAIASSVLLGPLTTQNLDMILLKDLQAVLGETGGSVSFAVYVGPSAEKALSAGAVFAGTWSPGRSINTYVRQKGHAIYLQLTATNAWAMEVIRARIAGQGRLERRRKWERG